MMFHNHDLQQLIDAIIKHANTQKERLIPAAMKLVLRPDLIETVVAAGQIPARLHARKPHEEHTRDLRPVLEEDAECAIACIGLLLREFEWAI